VPRREEIQPLDSGKSVLLPGPGHKMSALGQVVNVFLSLKGYALDIVCQEIAPSLLTPTCHPSGCRPEASSSRKMPEFWLKSVSLTHPSFLICFRVWICLPGQAGRALCTRVA
jgi:hypothetical protein